MQIIHDRGYITRTAREFISPWLFQRKERDVTMHDNDIPVFSLNDLIEAYKSCEASPEEKEAVLYFISELTGKSVDALAALGCE